MQHLFVDIETYSSADIASCGAYKYIESPDFEILIIGYAVNDGRVHILDLTGDGELPKDFTDMLLNPEYLKIAHNAVFERLSFRRIGYDVPVEQWYCTMVKAAYCGLPLSLDAVSKALDITDKKLSTGKLLIKYFSCPCKPTKINGGRTRNLPEHAPEKWAMYKEYNMYDVLSEREIFNRLDKYVIPEVERKLYVVDQKINDRGIRIDKELAESAIAVSNLYTTQLSSEVKRITGIDNPSSVVQLKEWIRKQTGETVNTLAKEDMQGLKEKFVSYPKVVRVLEIREMLGRVSVKKYDAMLNCMMSDGRARGTFQFYGANRTGRWAGRLIQLQNLSKNHTANIEVPRELIRKRDWEAVEMMYGDVMDMLSQLVRTGLVASPGKVLSVADFSAIEARVISWLADEKWRLEVFHGDGKIYEAAGSKMFNVPISAITKGSELRQKSKISELALGFQGGVGALMRMGGDKMGLTRTEMQDLVTRWRSANPAIVAMWYDIERAAKEAVRYHRPEKCTTKGVVIDCDGEFMTVLLPSGRQLFYYKPELKYSSKGSSLQFQGIIQETKQWGCVDTYGGKLTENIVQAVARDLLGNSMKNLTEAGFPIVAHIHDECLVEVPEANALEQYAEMERVMSTAPAWAEGLPLNADGYVTPFYLKN